MPDKVLKNKGSKRICTNGHVYYKSSSCPVCPVCEKEARPADGFLSLLAAPARRAIQNAGIGSLEELSGWSENELLQLHGIGKTALPILIKTLQEAGLTFKTN